MDDFNSNVRRFQSNQSISDINNIHTDLVIMFFDRRNQNIGKKQKECKFVLGVQFVSRKTSRKSRVSRWTTCTIEADTNEDDWGVFVERIYICIFNQSLSLSLSLSLSFSLSHSLTCSIIC